MYFKSKCGVCRLESLKTLKMYDKILYLVTRNDERIKLVPLK